jgi:hypothetical protein
MSKPTQINFQIQSNKMNASFYSGSPDQSYLEHLYSKIVDKNGSILDRFIPICDQLDIQTSDI